LRGYAAVRGELRRPIEARATDVDRRPDGHVDGLVRGRAQEADGNGLVLREGLQLTIGREGNGAVADFDVHAGLNGVELVAARQHAVLPQVVAELVEVSVERVRSAQRIVDGDRAAEARGRGRRLGIEGQRRHGLSRVQVQRHRELAGGVRGHGGGRQRERPDAAGNRTIRQRRPPEHLQTRGVDQRALCVEMERSRARVERARQTIDAAGDCKEPLTRQRDVSSITGLLQRTLSENLIDAAQPGADARSRVPPGQEYVFKVAALALEADVLRLARLSPTTSKASRSVRRPETPV